MYTPITIIGTGATGLLLLHMFQEAGIPPHDITCIDPHFVGGALQTQWAHVISNTQWHVFQRAMTLLRPQWRDTSSIHPSSITPLSQIIQQLRNSIRYYQNNCQLLATTVTSVSHDSQWWIELANGTRHSTGMVFFCTGAKPKTLSLPIPSIPLEKALVLSDLKEIVQAREKIIVFGTQHSGCLVMKNLEALACETTCVYKHSKPFSFARDGEYDGIKEDAATIADSILAGHYKHLTLTPFSDSIAVASAFRRADWVVYAIGFEPSVLFLQKPYIPSTGKFPDTVNAWGFGIAFPSSAPDSIHYDVSILAFTEHMLKQKDEILENYRSIKLHDTN